MPTTHDASFSLISSGTPLIEYTTPTEPPTLVYCESKPDQTFEVSGYIDTSNSDLIVELFLDGIRVHGFAFYKFTGRQIVNFRGLHLPNDLTQLRPFQFSNIKLIEEDTETLDEKMVGNLGTVEISITRCIHGQPGPPIHHPIPTLSGDKEFCEKNKKASMIPHTIGLGKPVPAFAPPGGVVYTLSRDRAPYERLIWQYRSRNVLIAKGIISRPNPTPTVPTPRVEPTPKPDQLRSLGPSSSKPLRNRVIVIDGSDDEEPQGSSSTNVPNQKRSTDVTSQKRSINELKPDIRGSNTGSSSKKIKT